MKLRKKDLKGYNDLASWLVVSDGEGVQPHSSLKDAVASAKEQAKETPGLILGVYQIAHYVSARVQAPQTFDPELKP